MPDMDWVWYDTCVMGATAGAAFELFQIQLGADATHNEQFTNLPLPGQIPQNEKFSLEKIMFSQDFVQVLVPDGRDWPVFSVFEIKLNDTLVFKAPLSLAVGRSAYSGDIDLAAAATLTAIGLEGDGYEFKRPILFGGGDFFKVRVVQGTAITASSEIKCMLIGTRSTKQ